MAEKIFMIALSPTMDDGKIQKWHKNEGDVIAHGDVICEVETDKASMDYESFNAGTILKIIVPEGGVAKIGHTIAIVGKSGEDISDILHEIEPEHASVAAASSDDNAVDGKKDTVTEKSEPVQKPVKESASSDASVPTANVAPVSVPSSQSTAVVSTGHIKASPLARRVAENLGVNLYMVKGTGPNGRVLLRDVKAMVSQTTPPATSVLRGSGAVHITNQKADIEIPVVGVRAVIAKRLSQSKFSAPHFYVKVAVRSENLVGLRTTINKTVNEKISMNAFFIKLAASAITHNPEINSSWNESTIIQHASIDIGLAVDAGNGLITPVVRDCGNKGVQQIDSELQVLIQKVRDKKLSMEEYTGATFTISNLGSFGIDEFTAIINTPGSAILAVGMNRSVPVVNDQGSIEVGQQMMLTLSSDHRVIDGSRAAYYMSTLRQIIENPALTLL